MYPNAANADLPEALDNLKMPVAYVEAYRQPGDNPANDTALVQRACDAVKQQNGAVYFATKQYNVGTITLGTEGQRWKCDLIGAAWNGDVGKATPGGTYIKLLSGTNASMFVVPSTAPPVEMRNLWLDGNKATNTCTGNSAVILFPDYTVDATKARSGNLHNIRIDASCNDGIYGGYLRNAGVLDHVVILDSRRNGITLASNSDWRVFASDIGSATGLAFQCTGCGSLTSLNSAYFTSLNGVKIETTALDVTFIGGSIDTNQHDGLVIVGVPGATTPYVRNFIGVRFNQNGLETNNTYADIKLADERNAAFINPYFLKGSPAGTGGNYEKYLVNADATSRYLWQGAVYARDAAQKPFVTAALNDASLAYGTVPTIVCRSTTSPAAHTGTTAETVIATCPIPANTIQTGQRFEIKVGWSFLASTNNKIVRAKLGAAGAGLAGVVIGQQTVAAAGMVALRCESEFVANAVTGQKIGPIACGSGTAATSYSAATVNLAADAEIVLTGELASAGETITLQSYTGTLYP